MVHVERTLPGVAVVRLDNPPVNALSRPTRTALAAALAELEADVGVRCLVLTGTGDKAFCAGADLSEQLELSAEAKPAYVQEVEDLIRRLAEFPCPVLGALSGHILGAGLDLALACDLRMARAGARLGVSGVNVGLISSTTRLVRLLGESRAKDMCLTGRQVPVEEAAAWGLVHRVVAPEAFRETALEWAGEIAAKPPLSARRVKAAINRTLDLPLTEALGRQQEDLLWLMGTADHREAVASFLEKRKPQFTGT